MGFPGGSDGREPACECQRYIRNVGSIPGSRRPPEGGLGNPLQCSCLENPTGREAHWATVQGVAKSRTRLSDNTLTLSNV